MHLINEQKLITTSTSVIAVSTFTGYTTIKNWNILNYTNLPQCKKYREKKRNLEIYYDASPMLHEVLNIGLQC